MRYAISEGVEIPGAAARWSAAKVDFLQLRAKDVDAGELARRARALLADLRESKAKLLINGRADVALAVGAAGVHLTGAAEELTVSQVRRLMPGAVVSVSCHSLGDVEKARDAGADLILFGPVFEKQIGQGDVLQGVGLAALGEAARCAAPVRVLALGGVDEARLQSCVDAGACGYASIRSF